MAFVRVHNIRVKYAERAPVRKGTGRHSKGHRADFCCATVDVAHNGICLEVYECEHNDSCHEMPRDRSQHGSERSH